MDVEARMASPDFWNNKESAQSDVELVSELRSKIQPFQALESRAADLAVLKELAAEESPDQQAGIIAEVTSEYESLLQDLEKFELQQFLSGEFDKDPAFLTIHAGAGGTESCDWAEMLLRMYSRWDSRYPGWRRSGRQIGHPAGLGRSRLRLSKKRSRCASPGANLPI